MSRLVYRPGHPNANDNGMVPFEIAGPKHGGSEAFYVISDEISATRHMADGRYYTSKAKFREATKAHGCVEVGNETEAVLKPRKPIRPSQEKRIRDIRNAIEQLRNR
jgi:hypothetical protein